MKNKKAVLLINLGTPADSDIKSIRAYLREFLNDPRVIDLPPLVRWPLVNLFIVPFRAKSTTKAYQKIWQDSGSPLLVNSQKIQSALAASLKLNNDSLNVDNLNDDNAMDNNHAMNDSVIVELGMRYGQPSIASAFEKIKHCDQIIALPLFPQYSSAATGSAIEELLSLMIKQWNIPGVVIKKDFYNCPGFINACAEIIKNSGNMNNFDIQSNTHKLIFSYHGLPERHIIKSGCESFCENSSENYSQNSGESYSGVSNLPSCCNNLNRYCYRAQCFETSQLIAEQLALNANQYTVSFQSRLGRTPWIKPYTDLILPDLIQQGIKNITIVSPSFVADCLETLEEINIRTREQWMRLGGEKFTYIPCVNDHPTWIAALKDYILN